MLKYAGTVRGWSSEERRAALVFVDKEKSADVISHTGRDMKATLFRLICLIAVLLAFAGCRRQNASSIIERHHQFSMTIGKMEDQIDLIQLPGQSFSQSIDIEMKNGLFFISNGASKKVMEFSSYGDLLTLYYNSSANPAPVLLSGGGGDGTVSNRKAFAYPFNEVGEIAVAYNGLLYVQDTVVEDRRVWDDELSTQLRNVILRFGPDGELIDFLGQEGVSGMPFPFIDSVSIGNGNHLTVVTRTVDQWIVFSFDESGNLRHRYSFADSDLPEPEEGSVISLGAVISGPEQDRLYVKADYYRDHSLEGETQDADYRYDKSIIHWIDTAKAVVTGSIELPPAYRTSGLAQMFNREEEVAIQYFVGSGEGGILFLVSPASDELYNLVILNTSGMVVHRGALELNDSQTLFRRFYVTPDGILTAIIGGNTEADIVLWRTDRLLGGET